MADRPGLPVIFPWRFTAGSDSPLTARRPVDFWRVADVAFARRRTGSEEPNTMRRSEINNVHLLEKARDALAEVIAEFKPDTIDGHFLYTSSRIYYHRKCLQAYRFGP